MPRSLRAKSFHTPFVGQTCFRLGCVNVTVAPRRGSYRRLLSVIAIGAGLVALTVFAIQGSTWVFVQRDTVLPGVPALLRVALLWLLASLGPSTVVVCARLPRSRPLFSRAGARIWAPWLATAVLAWFGFVYWLGFVGAGLQARTVAFAVAFCCASSLTPLAIIGLAFRRRFVVWLLPSIMLGLAIGFYAAYYQEFLGRY